MGMKIYKAPAIDWALITPVEAYRLRHNLPGPEAPPCVLPRFDSPLPVDDTSDSPDPITDHTSDHHPTRDSPGCADVEETLDDAETYDNNAADVDELDESDENETLSQGDEGDGDLPPTPPQLPRSPPPPPLVIATRPPMPFPMPLPAPLPARLYPEPLQALGFHLTGGGQLLEPPTLDGVAFPAAPPGFRNL
ncbi:hypothetical protein C8J57DRAFT_1238993 [Mycena rebaudengoi]|nr:hypothetical protein C8J57DRAFT_1238993 [Mycena rebaudengoi]